MTRPEHVAPPEIFYNDVEARKYTSSNRISHIQDEITRRAIELLALPENEKAFILDIGCGSGLSGQVLEEHGHIWAGMDISESMLRVAQERDVEGDLLYHDIGNGINFRPGTFDGAISISVIQWLCNADKSTNIINKRLLNFFNTLYSSLCRGARAVLQFYPENPDQIELILKTARRAGFTGGLVIDYPNSTRVKKHYLCITSGYRNNVQNAPELPAPLQDEKTCTFEKTRLRRKHKIRKNELSRREWILHKKEVNVSKGKNIPRDSKYTGRKRSVKF